MKKVVFKTLEGHKKVDERGGDTLPIPGSVVTLKGKQYRVVSYDTSNPKLTTVYVREL